MEDITLLWLYQVMMLEIESEEFLHTRKRKKEVMDSLGAIVYDHMTAHECGRSLFTDIDSLYDFIESVYHTAIALFTPKELSQQNFETNCRLHILEEIMKREILEEPVYTDEDVEKIKQKIMFLDKLPQPAQRSEEWYAFRKTRLTASDFGTAVGINPYSDRKQLIRKKCGEEKPFHAGAAILHGVKYEDVAIAIYERRCDVIVREYGCIPHITLDYIGASPDGICCYESNNKHLIGRMLEIKCPSSRVLIGTIPDYYHLQVQGQLEVCDLEWCDFLQCIIKEVDKTDFYADVGEDGNNNFRSNKMEKGVLITYYDNLKRKEGYKYAKVDDCLEEKTIKEWIHRVQAEILDKNDDFLSVNYWILNEYSCILVKRDRKLWERMEKQLRAFWDDVLHYREIGYQSLIPEKKKKYIKKSQEEKDLDNLTFLSETEDES